MVDSCENDRDEKGRPLPAGRKERQEAIKLYRDTDMSVDDIGSRFGVSRQTVHRWINDAGVPLRGAMGPRSHEEDGDIIAEPSRVDYLRLLVEHDDLVKQIADLVAHQSVEHQELRNQVADLTASTQRLIGRLEQLVEIVRPTLGQPPTTG